MMENQNQNQDFTFEIYFFTNLNHDTVDQI